MKSQRGIVALVSAAIVSAFTLTACGGGGSSGTSLGSGETQSMSTVPAGVAKNAGAQSGLRAAAAHFDHAYVVYMENEGFDDVVGFTSTTDGKPDTPFITKIALQYGLATMYFGATHPSLPNYLAFLGGYTNNISDDNPSCFATPPQQPNCHAIPYQNLVDQLENAHLTWAAFEQSMPSTGYLGPRYPTTGPTLYAQKHNPFVYYNDIAKNKARLSHIMPLDANVSQLKAALSNPGTAPNFAFIVPDQCHDMHGTSTCPNTSPNNGTAQFDALLRQSDAYLQKIVTTIQSSPSFTSNSVLFITWDENDYTSNLGCCGSGANNGGGHVATIVITPRYTTPIRTADLANHYTLLRTVEDGFGLPPLAKAAQVQTTLLPLIP